MIVTDSASNVTQMTLDGAAQRRQLTRIGRETGEPATRVL